MARNSVRVGETENAKFVKVSSHRFVVIELDLTSEDWNEDSLEYDNLDNAVVKIVVKYFQGEKNSAESVVERLLTEISRPVHATHHIRKAEYFPVRKVQSRASEIVAKLKPIEAAEKFLERFQSNVDQDELLRLLREHLSGTVEVSVPQSANYAVRKLGVNNFMPFKGNHNLEIPDGVFGVFGKYDKNDDKSNRAGKSAFLDAILFGRYGKTKRGLPIKEYVHKGKSEAEIEMTFDIDGKDVELSRQFGKVTDLKVGDVTGTRNAQAHLDQLLGLSFEDFTRISFVGQNDVLGILANTSSEIKSVISKWIGVGVWDDVHKSVGSELKTIVSRCDFFGEQEFQLTKKIDELKDIIKTKEQIEVLKSDYEKVVQHNLKLKDMERNKAIWENELVEIEEVEAASVALTKMRSAVDIQADLDRLKKKIKKSSEKSMSCRIAVRDLRSKIVELQEQLSEDFDGVCPVDHGNCPRVDEINGCQDAKERIEELIKEHKAELEQQKELGAAASKTQDTLEKKAIRFSDEQDELNRLANISEKECRYRNQVLSDLEDTKDMVRIDPESYQESYLDAVHRAKMYDEAIIELTKIEKEKSVYDTKLKLYQALKVITSKTGIPSLQIENAVLQIEETANKFLKSIDSDIMLRFDFERELSKAATSCRFCGYVFPKSAKMKKCPECNEDRGKEMRDEFQVNVVEGERIYPLDADSGGGKTLLGLSLRIALSKFVGSTILFLDEICASLDVANLMKLMKMLVGLQDSGFRQVFVISHRREIAETLDKNLLVTRDQYEQCSTIDWM